MIARINHPESRRKTCLYRSYPTAHPNPIHVLGSEPLRIGRGATCEISIQDEMASRVHAVIEPREKFFVLRDEASTNGSLLNGVLTDEARLTDGDILFLGNTVFRVIEYDSERELEERISYIHATLDPMTNSHRINYFVDLMHREAGRVQRYGRDMTVLICEPIRMTPYTKDLPAPVIQAIVTRLRSTLRSDVCVSRLGLYNSIAILIPECGASYAQLTAERCREIIESKPFHASMGTEESIRIIVQGAHTPLPSRIQPISILQTLLYRCAETQGEGTIGLTSFKDLTDVPVDRQVELSDIAPENHTALTWMPAPTNAPTVFESSVVSGQPLP